MAEKMAGSIWVTPYAGKEWPVMLCDDDLLPKKFADTRPKGDVSASILLGRRIYKWVANDQLREFEPQRKYVEDQPFEDEILITDSQEIKLEKERRKAFVSDARDPRTPAFWKNYIEQRSNMRKSERKIAAKRKQSVESDSDIEIIEVKRSSSASRSPLKRQRRETRRRSNGSYLPTPTATPIKSKFGSASTSPGYGMFKRVAEYSDEESLFVSEANKPRDPFMGDDLREDNVREKNINAVRNNPPDDSHCTIFIGPAQHPFCVRKDKVGECDFLTDRIAFTEELKGYIDLEDTSITPEEFVPIKDYLNYDEFAPRLCSPRSLEGVVLSEEQQAAAMTISKVYLTALKLEFGALQLLCHEKLKALHPLSPRSLLIVLTIIRRAGSYERKAVHDVKGWLVDQLATYFWKLMQYEGQTFVRLLNEDNETARCVFQILAKDPRVAVKVD